MPHTAPSGEQELAVRPGLEFIFYTALQGLETYFDELAARGEAAGLGQILHNPALPAAVGAVFQNALQCSDC